MPKVSVPLVIAKANLHLHNEEPAGSEGRGHENAAVSEQFTPTGTMSEQTQSPSHVHVHCIGWLYPHTHP